MKTLILAATAIFAVSFLMPPKLKAQDSKEVLPVKESPMPETKRAQKKVALKSLRKTINPKTLEPNRKAQEVTVDSISRIEGGREGLMYILGKNGNSTGGYFYNKPTTDMIMASMDSFYGDQYLNPYIQPNLLNGGEETLHYWGSGDVTQDGKIDWDDYNAILNSTVWEADVDGNGIGGEQADKNLLHGYLIDSIPYLPAHWNFLQTQSERINWFENYYLNVDTTDLHPPGPNWDCYAYTNQFQINPSGIENISEAPIILNNPGLYDTTKNAQGNMPVYQVYTVYDNGDAHSINAIFVGGPNVDSTTNFDGWYFYEPQNDTRVYPGDPSMDPNELANISKYVYYWNELFNEYQYGMAPTINFDLENGEGTPSYYPSNLTTSPPTWQSYIHIGGEGPSDTTLLYQSAYENSLPDTSVSGNVVGNANWSTVYFSDSTNRSNIPGDSANINFDFWRDFWAKSDSSVLIDTMYMTNDSRYSCDSAQHVKVRDWENPEITRNQTEYSIPFSEWLENGIALSDISDNSGYWDSTHVQTTTFGSNPDSCNYYNGTVTDSTYAWDPVGNDTSDVFDVSVYLDDSYWSYFPSDDSIPFYYPMIPDSTGGYAEATNPVLGDIPVDYEMINSTQDPDTTKAGHYQYDFDWNWSASDTICWNEIDETQHIDVFKPESTVWTYVPDSVVTTSEEGHDPSVTGGLAVATDTLLPGWNINVTYSDSLEWAQDLDSLFYRYFFAGPDIVGNSYDSVAVQPIYQVYTIGVREHGLSGFRLYPNPVHRTLTLETGEEIRRDGRITIRDAEGNVVYSKVLKAPSAGPARITLPVASLPGGIYFVKLTSGNTVMVKRFVKR